jgi:hypothetical protein
VVTIESSRPSKALEVIATPERVKEVVRYPGAAYAAVDESEVPTSLVAVTIKE